MVFAEINRKDNYQQSCLPYLAHIKKKIRSMVMSSILPSDNVVKANIETTDCIGKVPIPKSFQVYQK